MNNELFIQMQVSKLESSLQQIASRARAARTLQDLKRVHQDIHTAAPSLIRGISRGNPAFARTRMQTQDKACQLIAQELEKIEKTIPLPSEEFKAVAGAFRRNVMDLCRGDFVLAYQQGERGILGLVHKNATALAALVPSEAPQAPDSVPAGPTQRAEGG